MPEPASRRIGNGVLELVRGDITREATDAVAERRRTRACWAAAGSTAPSTAPAARGSSRSAERCERPAAAHVPDRPGGHHRRG
ncbi:MAG: hypothetical protein MZV64_23720 [Ignavibacteriales bacterium]|nr:hypothetical protein [Ignavibacteriales bacterium]